MASRGDHNAVITEAEEERMTEDQFRLATGTKSYSNHMLNAARRVLVEGESQQKVAEDIGIQPTQLSKAITNIRKAYAERLDELGYECREVTLPKRLFDLVAAIEKEYLAPLIEKQKPPRKSARKKRKPAAK